MKKISGTCIRRVMTRGLIGLLALTGVGYISSAVTQLRCEDAEARSLMGEQMKGKSFFVLTGDEPSQIIFSRVEAKYTLYTVIRNPNPPRGQRQVRRFTWPDGQPVPHVDKGGRTASVSAARIFLPFLVSVEHTAVYGSLGADGSTSYYFCLFGLLLKVREEVSWVS